MQGRFGCWRNLVNRRVGWVIYAISSEEIFKPVHILFKITIRKEESQKTKHINLRDQCGMSIYLYLTL